MTGPRIGSLFSGYGGLDLGVQAVLGGSVVWHVEFADAPSRVLAHHWPDVPNYRDVTTVDWAAVEPVDVLTGGFPCQDVSLAGARAGLMDGTRSGLWSEFAKAIAVLRPALVVIENVRGLLSARTMEEVDEADSDLEWATGGVGEPERVGGPVLNAFGRVLGDLADLGYVGGWVGVRAADAGAPHGRFRVFILAHRWGEGWPESAGRVGGFAAEFSGADVSDSEGERRDDGHPVNVGASGGAVHVPINSGDVVGGAVGAPPAADTASQPWRIGDGDDVSAGGGAGRLEPIAGRGDPADPASIGWGGREQSAVPQPSVRRSGNTAGKNATPDSDNSGRSQHGGGITVREEQSPARHDRADVAWGDYEPAIRRWEAVTGRVAPAPTLPDGRGGSHRLSAAFVEWMMGLPAGHVTNAAIGLTRNEQLKALGNGVVWQQAALAVTVLLERVA